jgi:hypothetical protein
VVPSKKETANIIVSPDEYFAKPDCLDDLKGIERQNGLIAGSSRSPSNFMQNGLIAGSSRSPSNFMQNGLIAAPCGRPSEILQRLVRKCLSRLAALAYATVRQQTR